MLEQRGWDLGLWVVISSANGKPDHNGGTDMTKRSILYAGLFLLFVLHQDFWLWNDASMILGLPIGLTYHAIYCLVVTILMGLLVRHAWPTHLDTEDSPAES